MAPMSDDDYRWAEGINEDMQRRHERIIEEAFLLAEARQLTDRDYGRRIRLRKDWSITAAIACTASFILLQIDNLPGVAMWVTVFGWTMNVIGVSILICVLIGMHQDRHYIRRLRRWNKAWKRIEKP